MRLLLARLAASYSAERVGAEGVVPFRDGPECPAMVVVQAGTFRMGSSAAEKAWAMRHGATPGSVVDEAPQHGVALRSFALGVDDLTRSEREALERAASLLSLRHGASLANRLEELLATRTAALPEPAPIRPPSRLVVSDGDGLCLLEVDQVEWFESAGNYFMVRLRSGAKIISSRYYHPALRRLVQSE